MSNVFEEAADGIRNLIEQAKQKIKARNERREAKDKNHEELVKAAEEAKKLLSDLRYPYLQRIISELQATLDNNMEFVLTNQNKRLGLAIFGKDYSREERVDKIAVIQGQKMLLNYLLNEPKEVIKIIEERQK